MVAICFFAVGKLMCWLFWLSLALALCYTVLGAFNLLMRLLDGIPWDDEEIRGKIVGPLLFGVVFGCFTCIMHRERVSNWFCSSSGLFGREIGRYEQEYLDEFYRPREENGRFYGFWKVDYRMEDGRYIVPIEVPRPINFFDTYTLHLLPMSRRSFLISGNRFYGKNREAMFKEYGEVKGLLVAKYGKPAEEDVGSCLFRDGNRKIGLICTDVLGKCQLYINAWRIDLLEKNLPKELAQYKKERRKEQTLLEKSRVQQMKDSL